MWFHISDFGYRTFWAPQSHVNFNNSGFKICKTKNCLACCFKKIRVKLKYCNVVSPVKKHLYFIFHISSVLASQILKLVESSVDHDISFIWLPNNEDFCLIWSVARPVKHWEHLQGVSKKVWIQISCTSYLGSWSSDLQKCYVYPPPQQYPLNAVGLTQAFWWSNDQEPR